MGLIKGPWLLGITLLLIPSWLLADDWQDYPSLLSSRLEGGLSSAAGPDKQQAYHNLAQLYELAGDFGSAATAWREAAFAGSEGRDDLALLRAARCLLIIGDFERADADIRTIRQTGRSAAAREEADLLEAMLAIIRGDSLLGRPLFLEADGRLSAAITERDAEAQALLLYLLYRFSGIAAAADRLQTYFPNSPEALSLSAKPDYTEALLPLMFLYPGREALEFGKVLSAPELPPVTTPTTISAASPVSGPAKPEAQLLQVGLFRQTSNAVELVQRLAAQGFKAQLAPRLLEGEELNAVVILVEGSLNEATLKLKDLGFEPFPIF